MGFLSNLFGGDKKEYPELDTSNPVAQRIENFRNDLENFVKDISDSVEVIPTDKTAYLFLGKPPKSFGIAWIRDGKINNFKTLAAEKGVSELKLQLMSEKLRQAYEKSEAASRFTTTVSDQKIIVTSSDSLEKELESIIEH